MIRIIRIGGGIGPTHGLAFPFDRGAIDAIKEIPGMRWAQTRKMWVGYPDAIAYALTAVKAIGREVPPIWKPSLIPTTVTLPVAYKGLRDYQKEGVRFLIDNAEHGALLADDLGLGKSIQAVIAARALKRPTLIVFPSFARPVWADIKPDNKNEIRTWWPAAWPMIRVLEGVMDMPFRLKTTKGKYVKRPGIKAEEQPPSDVFTWREAKEWVLHNARQGIALTPEPVQLPVNQVTVCHYDILYAWGPHLVDQCKTFILDEIHLLVEAYRETKTKATGPRRSRAAMTLRMTSEYAIGLTGTPMTGATGMGAWNALNTLSPDRFGSYYGYSARYCGGHMEQITEEVRGWIAKENTNTEELAGRLKFMMLRRTKQDVAAELPARTREFLDVTVPQRHIVRPGTAVKSTKATRRALELAGIGKIPFAAKLGASHFRNGTKAVIYTRFRKTAEAICACLHGLGVVGAQFIHGGLLHTKRARIIKSEPPILVTTMEIVSGAISLVWAPVGVFAELHVSPHILVQCEGRHHRIGAHTPVLYQYLIANGSLDDLLKDRVLTKLETFERIVGDTGHGLARDLGGKSEEEIIADLFNALKTD